MAATDLVQIFFTQTGDRFWTNRYYVNATTLDEAAGWANTILATTMAEQLDSSFAIVKTLVNHLADDTFVTTPLAIQGGSSNGAYLPLFNTVKVDVSVTGHGRNDGKFLRGWLVEATTNNGQITDTARASYEATMNGLIADTTAAGVDLVDKDGNLWVLATVRQKVQMRQEHRKRKKAPTP